MVTKEDLTRLENCNLDDLIILMGGLITNPFWNNGEIVTFPNEEDAREFMFGNDTLISVDDFLLHWYNNI